MSAMPVATDSVNRRIRMLAGGFAAFAVAILVRLLATEISEGKEYREVADVPIQRRQTQVALRGRILSRDGTVLAYDQPLVAVAIQYRWLEEPANAAWLRRLARSRLTAAQRRDPAIVAAEQKRILKERQDLAERVRNLCGLTVRQWQTRTRQIQDRVKRIAESVNARHRSADSARDTASEILETHEATESDQADIAATIKQSLLDALFADAAPLPSPRITVVEELSEHTVFEGLPLEKVAEIESHPELYPGVKLVHSYRRRYLEGELLAHVLGYLGNASEEDLAPRFSRLAERFSSPAFHLFRLVAYRPGDWLGLAGIERQYESRLRSQRGLTIEHLDFRGNVVESKIVRPAVNGTDLTLSIDARLQRTAEDVLDQALARRLSTSDAATSNISGGAAVVIDVHTGEILAAASAPRFDPNDFIDANQRASANLQDPARPLFDRTIQMAIPPGSVFKVVSALAILDAGIDPLKPVDCQGYLHQPEALRCAIFRRLGIGHGPVTLVDALARSCNVYFFHYAEQIGAQPLLASARQFGFGELTGIDLPAESKGQLPSEKQKQQGNAADASAAHLDPRPISIGQSTITVTPIQVARMMAIVASGRNVTPRIVLNADRTAERSTGQASGKIDAAKLEIIRQGLRQVVADRQGTAHEVLGASVVSISGKTGTAQTGGNRPDHAWFAGYAPADAPRVAFVVALEHAGDGATASGVVAKHIVERLDALGYLSQIPMDPVQQVSRPTP